MYSIKYVVNGVEHIIHSDGDKSILDTMISNNIDDVKYMCKSGYCGYCRCFKESGDVSYLDTPIGYIGEGDILTCISKPTSNVVLFSPETKKPRK